MSERERLLELCFEYELGTLEGAELREIEALLRADDPAAGEALEEARATVASLVLTAPQEAPPPAVKARLMAAVAAEKAAKGAAPIAAPAPPISMPPPKPRSSTTSWAAWALAACLLLAALVGWRSAQQRQIELADARARLEQLEADRDRLAQNVEQYQRILRILSGPETRAVALTATGNPRVNAYWNQQLGLVLAGSDLAAPAPERTLQLWIVPRDGAPVSVDVFRPGADGSMLVVAAPDFAIADAAALAISDEPAGGSPAPTTTPIWVGPLG